MATSTAGSNEEQCRALTEDGEQCSRPAQDDGFCFQHDESAETVDEAEEADVDAEADADVEAEADVEADEEANGDGGEAQENTMSATKGDIEESDIGQVREKVLDVAESIVGYPLDGITSIEHDDEGWRVAVEVVERRGVPDTQDILGRYEIRLNEDMDVTGYQRTHRYRRDDMDHDI